VGCVLRRWVWLAVSLCLGWTAAMASPRLALDAEELAWLAARQSRPITVAHDPGAGLDQFELLGRESGLLTSLLQDMSEQLGLPFVRVVSRDWEQAYGRFERGEVDVLFGANPTPERLQRMQFTPPVLRYPYMVFARRNSDVKDLSDLDGRSLGFLRADFVTSELPREYPNIAYREVEFSNQNEGLQSLSQGLIDGFVISGGGMEIEVLRQYPALQRIAILRGITSDMTFAVTHEQAMLGRVLNRYLQQRAGAVQQMAEQAQRLYHRKALQLSPAELRWLDQESVAVVGVAEDYLPFDYHDRGQYKGIAGATLQRIADTVGMRVQVVSAPFVELVEQVRQGKVHVLNMAKTTDRLHYVLFPAPISTERDIVVGLKSSPPVPSVYALDGQPVAVIEGFWHEEYLRKNLKNPRIVRTSSIQESLQAVRNGRATYLIENPTVVEFYINGLGYTDLVKRGGTSKDSFVYFGVSKQRPELAGIMDKLIPLIDFEEMKYLGIQSVPQLQNEDNRRLTWWLLGLGGVLVLVVSFTVRMVRRLIAERAATTLLREREQLLYTDSLTGFFNRNRFSLWTQSEADQADTFPQAVVVADMNHLKRVNDIHGHLAGDELIRLFARTARTHWPEAVAFRFGGDEFVFVLPGCNIEQVKVEVQALQRLCTQTQVELLPGVVVQPSASMGYAVRPDASTPVHVSVAEADQRMYAVKAKSRRRRSDWSDTLSST